MLLQNFSKNHTLLTIGEARKCLNIDECGLKSFIKMRWTSMYDCTNSIVRLRRALEEV